MIFVFFISKRVRFIRKLLLGLKFDIFSCYKKLKFADPSLITIAFIYSVFMRYIAIFLTSPYLKLLYNHRVKSIFIQYEYILHLL